MTRYARGTHEVKSGKPRKVQCLTTGRVFPWHRSVYNFHTWASVTPGACTEIPATVSANRRPPSGVLASSSSSRGCCCCCCARLSSAARRRSSSPPQTDPSVQAATCQQHPAGCVPAYLPPPGVRLSSPGESESASATDGRPVPAAAAGAGSEFNGGGGDRPLFQEQSAAAVVKER